MKKYSEKAWLCAHLIGLHLGCETKAEKYDSKLKRTWLVSATLNRNFH